MQFLNQVAKDILKRFNGNLSDVTVVFPNLRSRLFFNEYLVQHSEKTIFSPRYEDLDSLFAIGSDLKLADNLMLISILYNVYIKHYYKDKDDLVKESFDEFFFFGEILLNDFSDIDKYLADASLLYRNLSDLEQLNDNFEHLSFEQKQILERFFVDIKINRTPIKDSFFSIWSVLADIYNDFRNELILKGLAYKGMIYRDVIENFEQRINRYKQTNYVFVGFNVLTKCEEKLFSLLKHKSLFYWDYDSYFFENQEFEAGKFIKKNLQKFPQATEFDTDNLTKEKNISIISASLEVSQAGYIPLWIKQLNKENWDMPDTAIVFCNEEILLPVLQFIPPEVDKINVTMGFPLNQTPVYDFIVRLLELHQKGIRNEKFYYTFVLSVLNHSYTSLVFNDLYKLEDEIKQTKLFYATEEQLGFPEIFSKVETPLQMADYLLNIIQKVGIEAKNIEAGFVQENLFNEAIFRVFQLINRLKDLIRGGYLDIKLPTFISLIKRLLSNERVPFHGEPVRGLQLMGMLETRNMDFKNLIIISLNEGIMPKTDTAASFIPIFIRNSFGMSGLEHQDSIFAYYFYRLLQRTENAALLYNTSSNLTSKSEMSRFLLQLLTEFPNRKNIRQISLQNEMQPSITQDVTIEKTCELIEKIRAKFDIKSEGKTLSPTAINSFIDCPLQFYFRYVAGIIPPDELTDELDNGILGNIVHRSIEFIYRQIGKLEPLIVNKKDNQFLPFEVSAEQIDFYLQNPKNIEILLEKAFETEFFNHTTRKSDYNGEQLIYFGVALKFIKNLLRFDRENTPFMILGMEKLNVIPLQLSDNLIINIGGYIDRIRLKNNILLIDDYKVTSKRQETTSLEKLFDSNNPNRSKYIYQILFYSYILTKINQNTIIVPNLLYLPVLSAENSVQQVVNKTEISNFEVLLKEKLSELFDENTPFIANPSQKKCQWCDFNNICGK